MEGLILKPGESRAVDLRGTRIDFLLTAEHAKGTSMFEIVAAPGFDTGAHVHSKIEEIFYVLGGSFRCDPAIG